MLRSELIRETSLRTGYTQIVCGEIIRELFDIMSDELEAHGSIHIPNFGVFDVEPGFDVEGKSLDEIILCTTEIDTTLGDIYQNILTISSLLL